MATLTKEMKEIKMQKTNWLNNCKRCNGRVYLAEDEWGKVGVCLTCGNHIGIFLPETKAEWDALAKYLRGDFGASLPQDKDLNLGDDE